MGINATVNLGGSGYDIIVGLIQSNIRGAADDYDSTADQYSDARIDMWRWSDNTIQPAAELLSTRDATTTGMGAMNTFVKDYRAGTLASGRKILVVNMARGGTGFTLPSTNPSSTTLHWDRNLTNNSDNLAQTTKTAMSTILSAAGPGARVVAYLANHGSTDGSNNTPKATFKASLQDWITWFRTQTGTTNVPYVMMQMRPSLVAAENRHKIIDDAQAETATELPNVGYVLSPVGGSYERADSVHFNALGVRTIGHSLYSKWVTM